MERYRSGKMVRVPLKYQTVLRLMLTDAQMPGKESPLQGAEVEGVAYVENSSVIERPSCEVTGSSSLCGLRSPCGEVVCTFQDFDGNLIIIFERLSG